MKAEEAEAKAAGEAEAAPAKAAEPEAKEAEEAPPAEAKPSKKVRKRAVKKTAPKTAREEEATAAKGAKPAAKPATGTKKKAAKPAAAAMPRKISVGAKKKAAKPSKASPKSGKHRDTVRHHLVRLAGSLGMSIEEKTSQNLAALLAAGESVDGLYAELCSVFDQERKAASSPEQAKSLRDRWLGRKNGFLAAANNNWLKAAPRELKPQVGRLQNETRKRWEATLEEAAKALQSSQETGEGIDVTLPGPPRAIGAPHPVRLVEERVQSIFHGLGYSVAEGPEIETFYHNFRSAELPRRSSGRR